MVELTISEAAVQAPEVIKHNPSEYASLAAILSAKVEYLGVDVSKRITEEKVGFLVHQAPEYIRAEFDETCFTPKKSESSEQEE